MNNFNVDKNRKALKLKQSIPNSLISPEAPWFLIHVPLFYALFLPSFFFYSASAHILFCIFCFLLQQFLAFVCLTVRCFVARFICINMMLIFMISIMFHYAAFYDTSGSVCAMPPSSHIRYLLPYPESVSRFVSALIYGPFVYSCVCFACCLNNPPISEPTAPGSAILLRSVIYTAQQSGRRPASRILCALKSQFRRDLAGSKNLRTHYKRIIFS